MSLDESLARDAWLSVCEHVRRLNGIVDPDPDSNRVIHMMRSQLRAALDQATVILFQGFTEDQLTQYIVYCELQELKCRSHVDQLLEIEDLLRSKWTSASRPVLCRQMLINKVINMNEDPWSAVRRVRETLNERADID